MFDLSSAEPCAYEDISGDFRLVIARTAPGLFGRRWKWDLFRAQLIGGELLVGGGESADSRELCVSAANERVDLILTKEGR